MFLLLVNQFISAIFLLSLVVHESFFCSMSSFQYSLPPNLEETHAAQAAQVALLDTVSSSLEKKWSSTSFSPAWIHYNRFIKKKRNICFFLFSKTVYLFSLFNAISFTFPQIILQFFYLFVLFSLLSNYILK